jgi:diacylglycerol kinase (ATP)
MLFVKHFMDDMRHLIRAFFYSLSGLRSALGETAFRQELILLTVLAPLGLWLGKTPVEQALLVGSLLLVLVAELINSAIEAVIDRIGRAHHVLSGRAKDLASAAVFVTIINVIVVWALIVILPQLN